VIEIHNKFGQLRDVLIIMKIILSEIDYLNC